MFLVPKNRRNALGWPVGASSLFDSLFEGFNGVPNKENTFLPKLNASETDTEYTFSLQLPGYDEKEVDVSYSDGRLTIKGEKSSETNDENLQHQEFSYGSFERSITIPVDIIEKDIVASYGKGILNITLPKKAEEKEIVHKISVKSE